jgi:type I restriction enzyme S subunit
MTFEAQRLGDIAEIIGGGTPSTKDSNNWDGDIPWITPKDLSSFEGIYVSRGSRSITEQGFKSSSAKMLPAGAVLYTSRAPIGYVAIASNAISTNQGFKSLILKDGYVPEFVFYLLKASKSEIESHASGGTFAEISAKALSDVVLQFPPKVQQEAIAKLLKSLDEKIAINNAISRTLEDIAQAIFKSWFIDFDPVKAKMVGQKPAGMDDATAGLFPDSMEESELGLIPKGWQVASLGSIASIFQGKYLKPADMNAIRTVEFPNPVEGATKIIGYSAKSTFNFNFSSVSCRGSCGFVRWICSPAWISNNLMAIYGKEEEEINHYLHFLLKSINFESVTTGSVQGQITITNLSSLRVIHDAKVAKRFSELIEPIHETISTLERQSVALAEIRDNLMPRLISGELQIPEEMLAS